MEQLTQPDFPPLRLGVSACVIGEKVRFDGGHKQFAFVQQELAPWVEFIPFCPEVKAGLGIPRPTIRLADVAGELRVVESRSPHKDVTEPLTQASNDLVGQAKGLSGFVFCAKSPSCGMERVKVYNETGNPLPEGRPGVFAQALMEQYPELPCEDTGRLNDRLIRESFLCRLFCYGRWQQLVASGITAQKLIEFHSRYKLVLMAHSPKHYKESGPLLAQLKGADLTVLGQRYIELLMAGLSIPATRKKHVNVLMHIQGYFKRQLPAEDKKALNELILRYQQGILPLATPIEMLLHHLRHYPDEYLQVQYYFAPYPETLTVKTVI